MDRFATDAEFHQELFFGENYSVISKLLPLTGCHRTLIQSDLYHFLMLETYIPWTKPKKRKCLNNGQVQAVGAIF